MLSNENKITYDTIDSFLLGGIPGFSEFFYQTYDDSDKEIKSEVFGSLTDFFQECYKKNNTEITGLIVAVLNKLFSSEDKRIQDVILTGFIENLLDQDNLKMRHLREKLEYPCLQNGLDEMYRTWYGKAL